MGNIITISREYGSGGRMIGRLVAEKLNIPLYDKEIIELASEKSGLSPEIIESAQLVLHICISDDLWRSLYCRPCFSR